MSFARSFLFLFVAACSTTTGGMHSQATPLLVSHPEQHSVRVARAVEATERKDFDTAQRQLDEALADAPTDAKALFVQACVFLERGSLKEATGMVKRLRAAAPASLEAPVLEVLIERRGTHPTEDWRDSFLWAWRKAGRPGFQDRDLFDGMGDLLEKAKALLAGAWGRTNSAEVRLVLALAGDELDAESRRWLFAHLEEVKDPGLLLAALAFFQRDVLAGEQRDLLRSRLRRFAEDAPTDMQRSLLLLLEPRVADAPFTDEELRELERIAALPDFRPTSTVSMYAEAERLLRSAGVAHPENGAFMVTVSELVIDGSYLISKVVKASGEGLSADHRMRLGRVLWSLGERMAAESTLVERLVGLNTMREGAVLLMDSERLAQAVLALEEGREVARVSRSLELDAWPLPSLQEAMLAATVKDEWTHLRAFAVP